MTPELLCSLVIRPVLAHLEWPQPRERELLLCAIALQESGLKYRRQMPSGPARSWWQIEPNTAVDCLSRCCAAWDLWTVLGYPARLWRQIEPNTAGFRSEGLEHNDLGACAIAAGILRLHPGELPDIGKQGDAWRYYEAAWRPGKPRPEAWPASYTLALKGHQAHYGGPLVKREP